MEGSTLDATTKLFCAVVSGIIQRKDSFVMEVEVNESQVSMLHKLKDVAGGNCGVTVERRVIKQSGISVDLTVTVLELRPHVVETAV